MSKLVREVFNHQARNNAGKVSLDNIASDIVSICLAMNRVYKAILETTDHLNDAVSILGNGSTKLDARKATDMAALMNLANNKSTTKEAKGIIEINCIDGSRFDINPMTGTSEHRSFNAKHNATRKESDISNWTIVDPENAYDIVDDTERLIDDISKLKECSMKLTSNAFLSKMNAAEKRLLENVEHADRAIVTQFFASVRLSTRVVMNVIKAGAYNVKLATAVITKIESSL